MIRATRRTAHATRQCDTCRSRILPGDTYVSAVASPGHDDLGNTGWWRLADCATCARIHGYSHLIDVEPA